LAQGGTKGSTEAKASEEKASKSVNPNSRKAYGNAEPSRPERAEGVETRRRPPKGFRPTAKA